MLTRRSVLLAPLAAAITPTPSRAQFAPIDLGIPNIQQMTRVWCWAAVAEQIIKWRNGGSGPSQPELVSIANGLPPYACSNPPDPMVMRACFRTGHLAEIQALIAGFGGGFSGIAPPAHPVLVYQRLANRNPIILAVQSTPFSGAGHVVVLRGMIPAPNPLFIVNDPMAWSGFSQPVPFSMIANMWGAAIVMVS